ncbi:MAG: class I SAM-dependent methyltransferase [Syntrophales bacterium]|nr:class I SAM-dependent methyltransferase [Syntrophales bacterium]MDD5234340.1 class I SAM-dependent methyltransferase [Syntrophales bacterium]MDD5532107.1 class I SAM-dependent methyltransferase [Syntrophales bacterium]
MTGQPSRWRTRETSGIYLEGVRGAIPGAALQLEVISKIVKAWRPLPEKILDLGCGDGILGRMLMDEHAAARVSFADFSDPMLEKIRSIIGDGKRANIVNADFSTPSWAAEFEMEKPFDIIVSGFAIHHQPDNRKKDLYAEIHALLGRGGLFLNLDQVSSATPSIGKLFDIFFLDRMRGVQNSEQMMDKIEDAYYRDKKENIPASVEAQCQWLRDTGFQDVDCFFKTFELALFGGRKK